MYINICSVKSCFCGWSKLGYVYPLHGSDWECKDFLSITWFGTLNWCCIFTSLFIHTPYLPFQFYLAIKFNHLILKFELSEVLKPQSFWHHMWKVKCGHFNLGTKLNMCRNWWVGSRQLPVTFLKSWARDSERLKFTYFAGVAELHGVQSWVLYQNSEAICDHICLASSCY
jgi:hypothetical protein